LQFNLVNSRTFRPLARSSFPLDTTTSPLITALRISSGSEYCFHLVSLGYFRQLAQSSFSDGSTLHKSELPHHSFHQKTTQPLHLGVARIESPVIHRCSKGRSATLPTTSLLQESAKSDQLSLLPTLILTASQRQERAWRLSTLWKQRDLHVLTFFQAKISQPGAAFHYSGLTTVVFPLSAQSRLPRISYLLANLPSKTIKIF
jgi:hypothetical protein